MNFENLEADPPTHPLKLPQTEKNMYTLLGSVHYQGLKWAFVKNSEKRVAPLRLLKFDWMKLLHNYRFVHTPTPHERFLFKFTLISRMILKVGKNSEIRENSQNSNP